MLYGESIYLIDTAGGRVRLVRASAADIQDTANGGLRYRLDIGERNETPERMGGRRGRSPLQNKRVSERPNEGALPVRSCRQHRQAVRWCGEATG